MEQRKHEEELTINIILKHCFHTLSFTLLSLLLPLSFLLLARLSTNPYLPDTLFAASLPAGWLLLHLLVSFTCISALFHALTGRLPRPPMSIAWVALCLFQVCVSLGIEATVATRAKQVSSTASQRFMWIEHVVFVVGLFETTMIWSRMFVRPVVDDTVFGAASNEDRTDRVVIGVAFSILWLQLLREEVEQLVVGAGKGFGFGMGLDRFAGRLVGYVTVMVGMVRIVEGAARMVKLPLWHCREAEETMDCSAPVRCEV